MDFRIVSLLPATTEILFELGLGEYMTGRSHECDYPRAARYLPVCSETAYTTSGNAAEIHNSAAAARALSIFNVDVQLLKALKPTHIITQTQCDVCAVSMDELQASIHRVLEYQPQLIDFSPDSLNDYFSSIREIGAEFQAPHAAEAFIRQAQNMLYRVQHKASKASPKPSVGIIEWVQPIIPAGHWNLDFLDMVYAVNAFPETSDTIPFSDLLNYDPDILIIAPCGYPLKKTIAEISLLTDRPGWANLQAAIDSRVFLSDGNHYFNRPGSRLRDTLEIIAEIAHPEIFPPKHRYRSYLSWDIPDDAGFLLEANGVVSHPKKENFIAGRDFYLNSDGKYVFTGYYLLKRGYCCKNACLHCPYGYEGLPKTH